MTALPTRMPRRQPSLLEQGGDASAPLDPPLDLLEQPAPGRYEFHDLLRAYALDQVRLLEPAGIHAEVLHRVLGWYLHTADAAQSPPGACGCGVADDDPLLLIYTSVATTSPGWCATRLPV